MDILDELNAALDDYKGEINNGYGVSSRLANRLTAMTDGRPCLREAVCQWLERAMVEYEEWRIEDEYGDKENRK